MRLVLFTVVLSIVSINVYAMPVNSVTTTITTRDMEPSQYVNQYIGKPFDDQTYQPQYHGQKDDYNEAAMRNDPEVLTATNKHINYDVINLTTLNDISGTITRLDKMIRKLTYDPVGTTDKSRSPEQVIKDNMGNCYEVAKLAQEKLRQEGYETIIVDIKTPNIEGWHTICAFRELDKKWSLFQAAGGQYMGYTSVHADSIQQLLNIAFINVVDHKIVE